MRHGEHGILITVKEATEIFKVPAGTLRRWAHEDGWERFGGPRSRYWHIDQVQDSYDRRRSELTLTSTER